MKTSFSFGSPNFEATYGQTPLNVHDKFFQQKTADGCAFSAEAAVLHDYGFNESERSLQDQASLQPWYIPGQGTPMEKVGYHMESHGVPCEARSGWTAMDLAGATAEGKKIVAVVDSGEIWAKSLPQKLYQRLQDMFMNKPDHAVVVEGFCTDPGHESVIITDSGDGGVRVEVPLHTFMDAWADSNYTAVIPTVSPQEYCGAGYHENGIFDGCIFPVDDVTPTV